MITILCVCECRWSIIVYFFSLFFCDSLCKMRIDNFGSERTLSEWRGCASKSVTFVDCWPFVGCRLLLAYMLRVKCSLFSVQPHPRVNANKIIFGLLLPPPPLLPFGHRSCLCCSFAILLVIRRAFSHFFLSLFRCFSPLLIHFATCTTAAHTARNQNECPI